MLGAAGLSLSLASGAAAATGGLADFPTRNTGVSHEITLAEEEISGVSLATFYVFDKENAGTVQPRVRLAIGGGCACLGCGGCGCWTGTNYDASVFGGDAYPRHQAIKPVHKHAHAPKRKHVRKNP